MFVCTVCIEEYEGPLIDHAKRAAKIVPRLGMSFGRCEICRQSRGCYDLPSSNPHWYPKQAPKGEVR